MKFITNQNMACRRKCLLALIRLDYYKERKEMAKMKRALEEILNCSLCYGRGYVGWVSPDGDDYDFEYCECNPHELLINEGEIVNA